MIGSEQQKSKLKLVTREINFYSLCLDNEHQRIDTRGEKRNDREKKDCRNSNVLHMNLISMNNEINQWIDKLDGVKASNRAARRMLRTKNSKSTFGKFELFTQPSNIMKATTINRPRMNKNEI